ncbi:membrane protein [Streptomyces mirabilis]|nr:membrane protein [Streptomyces mirabilis]
MSAPIQLTRMHRILIGVVVAGALVIAGIGFAGSYAAVRELALKKGFGNFAYVFPIGIDAGICVLLALDLLLTWIRIPFPLLRQTAWLLTVATIAFNGAAAWPDPLGVGMHAVIPVLFVVSVEAARHAIGRIADITADKHMEGVRLTRWLLSPIPTFLLWRRMKLWELRSYEQVIKLEQDRLVYQARLHSRFGRAWRRKAPVESMMPLRLARYGVPLAETAPSGLAAAGIEPALLPPAPQLEVAREPEPTAPVVQSNAAPVREQLPAAEANEPPELPEDYAEPQSQWLQARNPQSVAYQGDYDPTYDPDVAYRQWYEEQQQAEQFEEQQQFRARQQFEEQQRFEQQTFPQQTFPQQRYEEQPAPAPEPSPEDTGTFPIPSGPGRTRELGAGGGSEPTEEDYYLVFKKSIDGSYPTSGQFRGDVEATYGTTLPQREADRMVNRFTNRHTAELQEDHIA